MLPYGLTKPLLFQLSPEKAHNLTLKALKMGLAGKAAANLVERRPVKVAGLTFRNPIGIAAGFDKNAEAINPLFNLGFGFVEAGTVTPKPQYGNPKPRLFRLKEDRGVINRFGFNSAGLDIYTANIKRRKQTTGILGGNVGANKESKDKAADYATGIKAIGPYVDYITINISSPNTPGLRDLQNDDALMPLLRGCANARKQVEDQSNKRLPLFLKIAPDLSDDALRAIAMLTKQEDMDALIVSNTTLERPASLQSKHKSEAGGLSGKPLKEKSFHALTVIANEMKADLPLISVGGIETTKDVKDRLEVGASLVQIYSALVYEGPALVSRLLKAL